MLDTLHIIRPFGATFRDDLKAMLFLVALVAAAVADMLSRPPAFAWYWHVAEIAYAGIAGALIVRRNRARY